MAHAHDHGPTTSTRLSWSAGIFFASFLLQGAGGLWTGSIGLVSDSLENLNDVLVNSLGILSLWIANRRDPDDEWTFGWHRIEVFNSLLGVGFLLLLAGAVGWEALHRFRHPVPIQTGWVLAFSGVGLVLNIAATVVLVPRDRAQLERDAALRSAYLHAFADSLTSISLVASMVLIRLTGWRWVDPAIALVILVVILRGAVLLLRDAVGILMHRAAFEHEAAKAELLALEGVVGVEDFRSWKVCSHLTVATAHVIVSVERLAETQAIHDRIADHLRRHHDVRHLTLHFETPAMAGGHHHRFIHRHDAEAEGHPHGGCGGHG